MSAILLLKAVYPRRRSYQLKMTIYCARGDCSRFCVVLSFSTHACRLWFEALLGAFRFDGACVAGLILCDCSLLMTLRA